MAWETPVLTKDGVRGVGVIDFDRPETRVVQAGLSELVIRGLEIRRTRNPVRLLGFRGFAAILRRSKGAGEFRFVPESAWSRDEHGGDWEPVRPVETPRTRPFSGDPTWTLQLMGTRGVADLPVVGPTARAPVAGSWWIPARLRHTSRTEWWMSTCSALRCVS